MKSLFDCEEPFEPFVPPGGRTRLVTWNIWDRPEGPLFPEVRTPDVSGAVTLQDFPAIILNRLEQTLHLKSLEDQITTLAERVEDLEAVAKTVPIQTFAPEPYNLLRPIMIVIEPLEDEFAASFFDANVCASGENEQEAFENLKSLILDIFDSLSREPIEKLGPEPRRQLGVLREFISVA